MGLVDQRGLNDPEQIAKAAKNTYSGGIGSLMAGAAGNAAKTGLLAALGISNPISLIPTLGGLVMKGIGLSKAAKLQRQNQEILKNMAQRAQKYYKGVGDTYIGGSLSSIASGNKGYALGGEIKGYRRGGSTGSTGDDTDDTLRRGTAKGNRFGGATSGSTREAAGGRRGSAGGRRGSAGGRRGSAEDQKKSLLSKADSIYQYYLNELGDMQSQLERERSTDITRTDYGQSVLGQARYYMTDQDKALRNVATRSGSTAEARIAGRTSLADRYNDLMQRLSQQGMSRRNALTQQIGNVLGSRAQLGTAYSNILQNRLSSGIAAEGDLLNLLNQIGNAQMTMNKGQQQSGLNVGDNAMDVSRMFN